MTPDLIDLWRRSPLSRKPRLGRVLSVADRSEVPDPLPRHAIVLSGSPPKWAILACPCGHGHTIELNLTNPRRPTWTVAHNGAATIHPSIDIQDPTRRCHFWLRQGRVHWTHR